MRCLLQWHFRDRRSSCALCWRSRNQKVEVKDMDMVASSGSKKRSTVWIVSEALPQRPLISRWPHKATRGSAYGTESTIDTLCLFVIKTSLMTANGTPRIAELTTSKGERRNSGSSLLVAGSRSKERRQLGVVGESSEESQDTITREDNVDRGRV